MNCYTRKSKEKMGKLTVNQGRRDLLKKRYLRNKVAALRNCQAMTLRNNEEECYCLMGAMMTDEEIDIYVGKTKSGHGEREKALHIFNEDFDSSNDYPLIYKQHDPYTNRHSPKLPVHEAIKRIIDTGVVIP